MSIPKSTMTALLEKAALVEPFFRFFQQSQTPNVVAWTLVGFLILVFGALPAYAGISAFLKSRRGRMTITASPDGLRIDERRLFRTRTLASYSAAVVATRARIFIPAIVWMSFISRMPGMNRHERPISVARPTASSRCRR